jgi:DNA-binding protein HU-beta
MNKAQLVEAIAKDANITKSQAQGAVDSFVNSVQRTLKRGQKVTLVGFGTFSTSKRRARTGRNPQTGRPIKIPAKRVAKFVAGKSLKDSIQ